MSNDTKAGERQRTPQGREWSVSSPVPKQECYPQAGSHTWSEFAGLAIEMGGYSDLTAIDPYTGRRFCLGQAFTCDRHSAALAAAKPGDQAIAVYDEQSGCGECSAPFFTAIRRLLDAMEAAGFPGDHDPRLDSIPSA